MLDRLAQAFGAAVADARRELVERGWFGRAEMPSSTSFGDRSPEEAAFPDPRTLRELHDWMTPADGSRAEREQPEHQPPELGIDH